MKIIVIAFLVLTSLFNFNHSQNQDSNNLILNVDSALITLLEIQDKIKPMHPFLSQLHPVVISYTGNLYIFDFDTLTKKYGFIRKVSSPVPLPDEVRASFPLSSYENKPSCIVTLDIFNSLAGYTTIFHEFIHCTQASTVEYQIKSSLKIAQEAAEKNDYSWELNHLFPYQDSVFTDYYTSFIEAVNENDERRIKAIRGDLKEYLSQVDFEYMVWQEWKEGFARFIENKIRRELDIEENHFGENRPYNRVTFYYGGELFINYLIQKDEELSTNIESLFEHMYNFGSS